MTSGIARTNTPLPKQSAAATRADDPQLPVTPVKSVAHHTTPFQMSTGSQILAGAVGAVGAGILGPWWFESWCGGKAGVVGAGLGVAVGLSAGYFGVKALLNHNHSSGEKAKNAAADHAAGVSTMSAAQAFLKPFDHDSSGDIQLVNDTGLDTGDERVFYDSRDRESSKQVYNIWTDKWHTVTSSWQEQRGNSAAHTLATADADHNGVVSAAEMAQLMAKSDVDRSGTLTDAEQAAFAKAHPTFVGPWKRS